MCCEKCAAGWIGLEEEEEEDAGGEEKATDAWVLVVAGDTRPVLCAQQMSQ